MTDWARLYRECNAEAIAVLGSLRPEQLGQTVPATPEWTVLQLAAHLAGEASDAVTGRMDGAPAPIWTARHVAEREGRTAAELTAIGVCIGPGSYTGARIGLAFAKGLAASCQLPLVGVQTLDILAAALPPDDRPLYAVFAAGRRRAGFARYRCTDGTWHAETEVVIATWPELLAQITEPSLLVGEIEAADVSAHPHIALPASAYHLRRAGFLADLAWARLRAGQTDDPATLQPLYAR